MHAHRAYSFAADCVGPLRVLKVEVPAAVGCILLNLLPPSSLPVPAFPCRPAGSQGVSILFKTLSDLQRVVLRGALGGDAGPSAEARPGQGLGPGRGGLPSTEAHPSSVEEPETPAAQRPGSHVSGNPLTVAERVQLYRSLTEGTEPALQGPARRRSCSDSPSPSPSRPSSSPVAKARKLFGDAAQSCGAEGDPGDSERSDHGQGVATSPGEEVSAPVSLLDGASGGLDRPTSAADEEADSRSAETRDVAEKEDERRRGGVEGGVGQGEQRQGECVGSGKGDEVSGTGEEGADGPVVAVPKETKQLGVHEISAHTTNGSPETTPSPPS